jgi:hypothetical protein
LILLCNFDLQEPFERGRCCAFRAHRRCAVRGDASGKRLE